MIICFQAINRLGKKFETESVASSEIDESNREQQNRLFNVTYAGLWVGFIIAGIAGKSCGYLHKIDIGFESALFWKLFFLASLLTSIYVFWVRSYCSR